VAAAAPFNISDTDWGASPSGHKARSAFNSSVAARAKGWPAGLGAVVAVACLPVGCKCLDACNGLYTESWNRLRLASESLLTL